MNRVLVLIVWIVAGTVAWSAESQQQLLQRADALKKAGQWAQAADVLEGLLESPQAALEKNRPAKNRALLLAAEVARQLGRHDDSLRFLGEYRRWIDQQPTDEFHLQVRREIAMQLAESYLSTGNLSESAATLEDLLKGRLGTVAQLPRLQATILLASVNSLRNRDDEMRRAWSDAAKLAEDLLNSKPPLDGPDRLICATRWICAREALGETEVADRRLDEELAEADRQALSPVMRWEAVYYLFSRARQRQDVSRAESHLKRAVREPLAKANALLAADLHGMLAELQREQGQAAAAQATLREAAKLYEAVVAKLEAREKAVDVGKANGNSASLVYLLSSLKRLRLLYQQTGELSEALRVATRFEELVKQQRGADDIVVVQARAARGQLLAAVGNYEAARPILKEEVEYWRRAKVEPLKLAHALNDWAAVERGVGNLSAAVEGFREALALREKHLAPDDPDLATSYRNLASVSVSLGQFAQAVELFQRVLEQCRLRGSRADQLRSSVLLEMAIAFKSQGQYPKAAALCRESLALQEALFGEEHFGTVAHHNALSALARLYRNFDDAQRHAESAWRLCQSHHREEHDQAAEAQQNLGVIASMTGRLADAEAHWRQALKIQTANGQQAQAAWTLNRLGLLAFRQHKIEAARDCFEEALKRQADAAARPQERYSTLCNLAFIRHEQKDNSGALALLREAIELTEAPRAATVGAERERADFLARFASAFDMLFDWNLAEGNIGESFATAERSHSRTFLDQLRLAGVDIRQTLTGDAGQELVKREAQLRSRVQVLRSELQSLTGKATSSGRIAELHRQVNAAQKDFTQAWIDIRNASPVYRQLLAQRESLLTLSEIQSRCLRSNELMLFYQFGSRGSHLLVIGDATQPVEHFELQLPEKAVVTLAQQLRNRPTANDDRSSTERGSVGITVSAKGDDVGDDESAAAIVAGPLTRRRIASLVAWYLSEIRQRRVHGDSTRGPVGTVQSDKGSEFGSPHTILAEALLPTAVRELIRRRNPSGLIVIPDGALHQLPFEALLLREAPRPQFVLDEFPPISYAPSANILANLRGRESGSRDEQGTLLTVGNPTYPLEIVNSVAAQRGGDLFRGHGGQLIRLPSTQSECERIEQAFGRSNVVKLLGEQATERNVLAELPRARWIHLAAHGLVDESAENLYGAIALTPPASGSPNSDEDGFLSYSEILNLPLSHCELAVLSACETNVGPTRPLEAGTSLAQAFLAAGAHRVIASHWTVSDDSTAELMATFFEGVATSQKMDSNSATAMPVIDYAASLQKARRKLRSTSRWSAPYFWAPFSLVGPSR